MRRLVVVFCYGGILLVTVPTAVGLVFVDRGRDSIIMGWAFCVTLLFAIGLMADLTRGAEPE